MSGEPARPVRPCASGTPYAHILLLASLATILAASVPGPARAQSRRGVEATGVAGTDVGGGTLVAPDTFALRGLVVDSATGAPLPATSVRLVEVDRRDVTHEDGAFHLRRVPAGRYTLIVEHIGYRTARVPVAIGPGGDAARAGDTRTAGTATPDTTEAGGATTPVDPTDPGRAAGPGGTPGSELLTVRLASSAIDLPGLLVTAAMGARSRAEAHRLSQVLGGRELDRQLDVTVAETVEGEAGLSSASMGPGPARPVIRGLSGDRILVLEDGERVGDVSSGSADHAVAVESSSAQRIEVVRGPAALFYGSNALGGVVNVVREEIPSSLPDRPMATVLFQGQSVNRGGAASGTYRQGVGDFGLRAEASGRWTGDVRTPDHTLQNSSIRTYSGALGASWVRNFGHLGGTARTYRSEYGIPPDSISGHASGVTIELERDVLRGEAVVTELGRLGELTATGSYTRYDHREIEASGAVGTAFGQNTGVAELVLRHRELGPFSGGGFGVRGQWQDYVSDNGRAVVRSDELAGAIYGIEELELGRWLLELGARYDVHRVSPRGVTDVRGVPVRERTYQNLSGSVAALWEVADGWRLGAAVARAFRAPSSDELFSQGPHLAAYTYEVGNPDLEAETGVGADLFVRVDRPGISAEAGVFWNEISEYSYPTNTAERRGDLFVSRFVNTDARFYGAEASGRWEVTGDLVLDGDVSWVHATNLALDEPLPLIPPLNGRLSLGYDRERWFAEIGWKGAAEQDRVPDRPELPADGPDYCEGDAGPACRPVPGEFLSTDGYGIIDAGAGIRWFPGDRVHSVTLRLENLTNELYRNHLSRIKELSPEPGFGATLTYRASL